MFHLPSSLTITLTALAVPVPATQEIQDPDATPERWLTSDAVGCLALFTWADFDGDGLVDAFVIQPGGDGHLLHNGGDGQFDEQSERRGLSGAVALSDAAWTDYDGDGRVDLLWTSPAGSLRLWRQTGGGSFVDETGLAGLAEVGGGLEVEWRDLDADGRADLRVAGAGGQRVFRNSAKGTFTEVDFSLDSRRPFAKETWLVNDARAGERAQPDRSDATKRGGGTPKAPGDRTPGGDQFVTTGGVTSIGPATGTAPMLSCASAVDDLASPGNCIPASSVAALGALYPMTTELNVDPVTGKVGVNKVDPDTTLHVVGQGRFQFGSDLSTNPGSGVLQVLAMDSISGLGIDANEIQTWGAELAINADNQFGTSINSSLFVTTAGHVGVGTQTPNYALEVDGQLVSGTNNSATGSESAVGGGENNVASGNHAAVGGGAHNVASGFNATVGGGGSTLSAFGNTASGSQSVVSGGFDNDASGDGSVIPGGAQNRANGSYSFAAGIAATADHDRSFVWNDGSGGALQSTAANQFLISAGGGVGIGTSSPGSALEVEGTVTIDGVQMATGAQSGHVLTSDGLGTGTWQAPQGGGGADSDWTISGIDMYAGVTGNVGIGTASPMAPLHLITPGTLLPEPALKIEGNGGSFHDSALLEFEGIPGIPGYILGHFASSGTFNLYSESLNTEILTVEDTTGFVGVGTQDPDVLLSVQGSSDVHVTGGGLLQLGDDASQNIALDGNEIMARDDGAFARLGLNVDGGDVTFGRQNTDGRVGVGLIDPAYRFHVETNGPGTYAAHVENKSLADGLGMRVRNRGTQTSLVVDALGGGHLMDGWAGSTRVFRVSNTGRVVTTALEITGGGDLVEAFDSREGGVEAGSVMIIDAQNPGGLTLSSEAYDTKVAGIVSGAGGVDHGIQMTQKDVLEGDTLLAMAGRVWCKCSTENGAIEPGDRLTTASLLGHAMKATDDARIPGTVIGKAMTPLIEGEGLVLVLVNLQ